MNKQLILFELRETWETALPIWRYHRQIREIWRFQFLSGDEKSGVHRQTEFGEIWRYDQILSSVVVIKQK